MMLFLKACAGQHICAGKIETQLLLGLATMSTSAPYLRHSF